MSVMSRTKAREIALHLIFEMGFQQFEEENLNERLDEEIMKSISGDIALYAGKLSEEQTAYIRAVVKGVANDMRCSIPLSRPIPRAGRSTVCPT